VTENKAARTEGVLKALRTYRAEQGLSAPFPTLSAALFDMDGVLFDSMPAHCRSWVQAAHEVGLQMSEEDVYWFEGQTGSYTIKLLYQRTLGRDASPEETKWLYERKTQLFNEYNSGKTLPGVELVLAELSDVERRKPRSWGGWMKPFPRSSPKISWSQARTCAEVSLTPSPT